MTGPKADEPMHEEDRKPSSVGGIVAAWAGSIILHAGAILGMYWLAPSLTPAPEDRAELQVTVIEGVRTTPPAIQSGETTGTGVPRAVMRPPVRLAPVTPPVVRSRARESARVPMTAVEARPSPRLRTRSVLQTSARRRSPAPARRVESVETDVAIRRGAPATKVQTRPAQREGGSVSQTVGAVNSVVVEAPASSRAPAPRAIARDHRGVRTIPSAGRSKGHGVVGSPAAGPHPSAETRWVAPPPIVQAHSGTTGGRLLEQAPATVRVAPPPALGVSKPEEQDVIETRTAPIGPPQAERRVTRTAPKLASLSVRQRSGSGSSDPIADYGWLAEAVHSRIAELKRYPQGARVNQWEGRVVLRAVIRDDGELAALSVRTSSGHHELDQEAMKLVRQICPVPLTHPLGRPEITMHIPITYSLDR